jgi:hypothetical protein
MLSHFLMTPMLSHFATVQRHFATVLGHFMILLAIHRCYSAQPFFCYYNTWGRSVILENDRARSQAHGAVGNAWLDCGHAGNSRFAHGGAGPSRAHRGAGTSRAGVPGSVSLLSRLGPGDGSLVHHPRSFIT